VVLVTPATESRPWEHPEPGDVVQTADGKLYRNVIRFETVRGRPLDGYSPAGCHIIYVGPFGERSCYCTTWFDWCAKAVREGGHYRRAGEEAR
jgi:hypothetical protein